MVKKKEEKKSPAYASPSDRSMKDQTKREYWLFQDHYVLYGFICVVTHPLWWKKYLDPLVKYQTVKNIVIIQVKILHSKPK